MKLFFVLSSLRHDALLLEFPELAVGHYAELASATGKVLCVHGNRIGIDPVLAKQQPKLATIQAKARLIAKEQQKQPRELFSPSLVRNPLFLPPISWEHHLIIGHLHRRFYDDKARVYNPGCWVPTSNPYDSCNLMLINDQNKDHPEPQILSMAELAAAVQVLQGV